MSWLEWLSYLRDMTQVGINMAHVTPGDTS